MFDLNFSELEERTKLSAYYTEGWETTTLHDLWSFYREKNTDPNQVVVYLHSKGSKSTHSLQSAYITTGAVSQEWLHMPKDCNICSTRISGKHLGRCGLRAVVMLLNWKTLTLLTDTCCKSKMARKRYQNAKGLIVMQRSGCQIHLATWTRGLHSASNRPRSSERTDYKLHQGVEEGTAFSSHGIPLDERLRRLGRDFVETPCAISRPLWYRTGSRLVGLDFFHAILSTNFGRSSATETPLIEDMLTGTKNWASSSSIHIVKHLETRTCSDSDVSGWVTQQFGYFDLATFFNIIFISLSTKIWCLKLCFVSSVSFVYVCH